MVHASYEDLLFPGVVRQNWQMMASERIALTGVLSRLRPRGALEVGVYHGGSVSLAAPFCERVKAIDIDPEVSGRFGVPSNVELMIGDSATLIPRALREFEAAGMPLNYVLIDADHSSAGVKRDIELVLAYRPRAPMIVLIHDSANPHCRAGILASDWSANPHVRHVEIDFVPGQLIEHSVCNARGEVWGGLALAHLDPSPRSGPLVISQGAATMVRCIQAAADDLRRVLTD